MFGKRGNRRNRRIVPDVPVGPTFKRRWTVIAIEQWGAMNKSSYVFNYQRLVIGAPLRQ
jgi:hypothetical protein